MMNVQMAELLRLYNYDGSFCAQKASDPSVWVTVSLKKKNRLFHLLSNDAFFEGLGDSSFGTIAIPRLGKSLFRRQATARYLCSMDFEKSKPGWYFRGT